MNEIPINSVEELDLIVIRIITKSIQVITEDQFSRFISGEDLQRGV